MIGVFCGNPAPAVKYRLDDCELTMLERLAKHHVVLLGKDGTQPAGEVVLWIFKLFKQSERRALRIYREQSMFAPA